MNEFKSVKFPTSGTVFDYYIDSETKQFVPWTQKLGRFELDHDMPLQVIAYCTDTAILPHKQNRLRDAQIKTRICFQLIDINAKENVYTRTSNFQNRSNTDSNYSITYVDDRSFQLFCAKHGRHKVYNSP